ncbi:pyridoxamine 5'-phosphate oxidase [Streptacidiphilus rugosus]|uniref:pyridoxamine 5'-phosphate oxidase n=1 Tax=Streptacidiphilus rugosus TaxID=405783 RepID=UPI00056D5E39|nr:pyridoxamine 5'-phosphate oxidase [Streptacidiphilus rugosus]
MTAEKIVTALRAHTTLTLAYVDAEGPQACAVLYAVTRTGSLVFVTSPGTRHGRALAAGRGPGPGAAPRVGPGSGPDSASAAARVAFTVQADGQEWTELTGVQGRGEVIGLADGSPERAAAWAAYTERFPFVTEDDRLGAALAATALWELRPDWLRLVDNRLGFGSKEEWASPPRG